MFNSSEGTYGISNVTWQDHSLNLTFAHISEEEDLEVISLVFKFTSYRILQKSQDQDEEYIVENSTLAIGRG